MLNVLVKDPSVVFSIEYIVLQNSNQGKQLFGGELVQESRVKIDGRGKD